MGLKRRECYLGGFWRVEKGYFSLMETRPQGIYVPFDVKYLIQTVFFSPSFARKGIFVSCLLISWENLDGLRTFPLIFYRLIGTKWDSEVIRYVLSNSGVPKGMFTGQPPFFFNPNNFFQTQEFLKLFLSSQTFLKFFLNLYSEIFFYVFWIFEFF